MNVNKLRGAMAEQNCTQRELAQHLGISEKTLYNKMKRGVFGTDEVETMIRVLKIEHPADIFLS
jgi:transcriptional regulator with XRE-family HTH domain